MHRNFLYGLRAVTLLGCFLLMGTMYAQQDWALKSDKDYVKVFYKATGNIHQIKLTTAFQAPLSGITHLLSEVPTYPKWGYKVIESRLLKKISETDMYYYVKFDFPWPLSDRDLVLRTHLSQDPTTKAIVSISHAEPDFIPTLTDYVRIRTANTKWVLTPGSNGWTNVEYYIHSDPGGNIPDWVVNMAIDVGPRETINRMRQLLRQPQYRDAKLAHIIE